MDNIESKYVQSQMVVCRKYNSEYIESAFDKLIGVALSTFKMKMLPVNGLRHPIESNASANWYIWAGDYSESGDFFQPIHVWHLMEVCPQALNYLGLAPGWRFLFDDSYEDVWFDESLLRV